MLHTREELHNILLNNSGPLGAPVGVIVGSDEGWGDPFYRRYTTLSHHIACGDEEDIRLLLDLYLDPVEQEWFGSDRHSSYLFEIFVWVTGWLLYRRTMVTDSVSIRGNNSHNGAILLRLAAEIGHDYCRDWIKIIVPQLQTQDTDEYLDTLVQTAEERIQKVMSEEPDYFDEEKQQIRHYASPADRAKLNAYQEI